MKPITFIIAIVALLLLGASPASAAVDTYSNTAPIAMPGAGTAGVGSPYPSSVSVAGKIGPVTDVKVTLHGVDHTRPE